jgi:NAD(P)H-dependent flavin oxidoreductase YrpB (nitropropane dioxygenase family)
MEPHQLMVLTPAGALDPSLAIAACRAGAVGVLDLEFGASRDAAADALARVRRFAGPGFGVLVRADDDETISLLLIDPARPARVILAGPDCPGLDQSARRLREAGIESVREVTSLGEALAAVGAGIDGVVLKGHEAGGRVGADTSFVLVQKWRQHADRSALQLPFWVRGGVGPNTAAACLAAGARGVVLDSQVLLARESPLTEGARRRVASLDGGESSVLGARLGEAYRIYTRPDSPAAQELAREEERLLAAGDSAEVKLTVWCGVGVGASVGARAPPPTRLTAPGRSDRRWCSRPVSPPAA